MARPLAVCPARPDRSRGQSCPIYKKRQQLLRLPRINIGYVSELTYRAREILSLFRSVFLLGALPLLDPPVISALIQMQLAPFCTFRSSSTKYRRSCCCATKKKAANLSTFLFRTIHLSKLAPSSFLANVSTSLFLPRVSYPPFLRDTIGSRGPEL